MRPRDCHLTLRLPGFSRVLASDQSNQPKETRSPPKAGILCQLVILYEHYSIPYRAGTFLHQLLSVCRILWVVFTRPSLGSHRTPYEQTGPQFKGVKMIPPGLHLAHFGTGEGEKQVPQ